jgi:hypothetical protein
MLTHVVLLKLKEPTAENMTAVCEKLKTLEGNVPTLKGLEVGIDIVRSERSYDVALISRFDSLTDMDAYQVHPFHKEVLAYIGPRAAGVTAVDFES